MNTLWNKSNKKSLLNSFANGFYTCRFQTPQRNRSRICIRKHDNCNKKIHYQISLYPTNTSITVFFEPQTTLPSWLTQEDIDYFASKFEKTSCTGGLNYYQALHLSSELTVEHELKCPSSS
ncbi:alpha/beta-Hydrolases superfamily protein [Striga asiatica]|uniref:Alpha/beta-Hydrolases superfamily protein n=1 Tax=Striga asiatica TaxID=4170 RepID=A0A5A7QDP3_STRAF|nr:alpha/beta-Hydrolases superfamily protein [Striga asiatica]